MIQMRSILDVADNSGARKIAVINPIGGSTGRISEECIAQARVSAMRGSRPAGFARLPNSPKVTGWAVAFYLSSCGD